MLARYLPDRCLETAGGGTAVPIASWSPIEPTTCPRTSGERWQGVLSSVGNGT
jgi:hypothetical protein